MTYIFLMAPEEAESDGGLVFLESPGFAKLADQHLGPEGMDALIGILLENPEAGAVIQGTEGARKIRVALPGRGKRGGARAIYYYRHARGAVFFLDLYPKNEKENLSAEDKSSLRSQIRKIKQEAYP
jgi:hypothetical protein